jgi:DNA replication and repair protein RecF
MILTSARFYQFRNLQEQSFSPTPGLNLLVGPNGQGKTNLLEALYLLTMPRSFRRGGLGDWVMAGRSEAAVRCQVLEDGRESQVEMFLEGGRRSFLVDGKKVTGVAQVAPALVFLFFGPDDLQLLKGAPQERRRFLDRACYNLHPAHLALVQDFGQLLKDRNALLRDFVHGRLPAGLMESYDQRFVELGLQLCRARQAYVEALKVNFQRLWGEMRGVTGRAVDLAYEDGFGLGEALTAPDAATRAQRALAAVSEKDLARLGCSVGPQVDDLAVTLDGQDARSRASQGQTRSICVVLRVAELATFREQTGRVPVLLLDDLSSELDRPHQEMLMAILEREMGQVLLTTTRVENVVHEGPMSVFRVSGGVLEMGDEANAR